MNEYHSSANFDDYCKDTFDVMPRFSSHPNKNPNIA